MESSTGISKSIEIKDDERKGKRGAEGNREKRSIELLNSNGTFDDKRKYNGA